MRRYRLQVWNRFTQAWQDQHSTPHTTDDRESASEWFWVRPDHRRVVDTEDGTIVHQPRD